MNRLCSGMRLVVGLYRLHDFSRLQPGDDQRRPVVGLDIAKLKLVPRE